MSQLKKVSAQALVSKKGVNKIWLQNKVKILPSKKKKFPEQ